MEGAGIKELVKNSIVKREGGRRGGKRTYLDSAVVLHLRHLGDLGPSVQIITAPRMLPIQCLFLLSSLLAGLSAESAIVANVTGWGREAGGVAGGVASQSQSVHDL